MAAFVDEKFVQMNETIQSDPIVDQVSSTLVTVSQNRLDFLQSRGVEPKIEAFELKVGQLFIIQNAIVVGITDSKHACETLDG